MKKALLLIIAAVMIFSTLTAGITPAAAYQYGQSEREELINGIVNWYKQRSGSENGGLMQPAFLDSVGTSESDWLVFALSRYTYKSNVTWDYVYEDNYFSYVAEISEYVNEKYQTEEKLDALKATQWHRIALTLSAIGADPTEMIDGDLIADGTYNRGLTVSPGREGITGWIWGLIAMDSMAYSIPQDAYHTRYDFIREILRGQLSDGGFALYGSSADADVTAMAIQALAPYYNSNVEYQYTSSKIKNSDGNYVTVRKSVRQVINEALNCLSKFQTVEGDIENNGIANCESTAQVIIALCSLNLNPLEDTKFIKQGKTLLDGLKKYLHDDGGFVHSFEEDVDHTASKPGDSDVTASNHALMALVALYRYESGMRALFDLRPEMSTMESSLISDLNDDLEKLGLKKKQDVTLEETREVIERFLAINQFSRRYIKVRNFDVLTGAAGIHNLVLSEEQPVFSGNPTGNPDDVILTFTQSDKNSALEYASVENVTTKDSKKVNELLDKLSKSDAFEDKDYYQQILDAANSRIAEIEAEIEAINKEIKEKLYPFNAIRFEQKAFVDGLVERYKALSDYDKTRITNGSALLKAQELLAGTQTTIILGFVFVMVAFCGGIICAFIVRKRRAAAAASVEKTPESQTDEE